MRHLVIVQVNQFGRDSLGIDFDQHAADGFDLPAAGRSMAGVGVSDLFRIIGYRARFHPAFAVRGWRLHIDRALSVGNYRIVVERVGSHINVVIARQRQVNAVLVAKLLPVGIPACLPALAVEPLVMLGQEDVLVAPPLALNDARRPVFGRRLRGGIAVHHLVVKRQKQHVLVDEPITNAPLPGVAVQREIVGDAEKVRTEGVRTGHVVVVAHHVGEHVVPDKVLRIQVRPEGVAAPPGDNVAGREDEIHAGVNHHRRIDRPDRVAQPPGERGIGVEIADPDKAELAGARRLEVVRRAARARAGADLIHVFRIRRQPAQHRPVIQEDGALVKVRSRGGFGVNAVKPVAIGVGAIHRRRVGPCRIRLFRVGDVAIRAAKLRMPADVHFVRTILARIGDNPIHQRGRRARRRFKSSRGGQQSQAGRHPEGQAQKGLVSFHHFSGLKV